MRFATSCNITWPTRISLRTWQQSTTRITQPLHCNLQPDSQQMHRMTHTWTTTRCRTQRRNRLRVETIQAAPAAHTRYLSSPAAATLHGKNTRFRASASSPNQSPCKIHAAITLRSATRKSNEQPLVAEHRGGTDYALKQSKPHPPHTRGTFHRQLQPLYTEKHKVSCSGFLPKSKPMQQSCSHCNAFCNITWPTHTSLRTWQQNTTTITQPLHCDLQPESQQMHRMMHTWTTTRCRTQRRNRLCVETIQAAPAAHTRYLSSPAAATLHGKNTRFRASAFPQTRPSKRSSSPLSQRPSLSVVPRFSVLCDVNSHIAIH